MNNPSKSKPEISLKKIKGEVYLDSKAFGGKLVLTEERAGHLHPEVSAHESEFFETLDTGDKLRKETGEIVLFKWYTTIYEGKHMVIIVIDKNPDRAFIVTAMITRKMPKGKME